MIYIIQQTFITAMANENENYYRLYFWMLEFSSYHDEYSNKYYFKHFSSIFFCQFNSI